MAKVVNAINEAENKESLVSIMFNINDLIVQKRNISLQCYNKNVYLIISL